MQLTAPLSRCLGVLRRLRPATAGLASIEFAISMPLLFLAGLGGAEMVNLAIRRIQVDTLATQVADHAARIGEQSKLQNRRIFESDLEDIFRGVQAQSGGNMKIFEHGRIIVSSQEVTPTSETDQYIHWQRCKGAKRVESSYGDAGDGLSTTFVGMGPPGEEIIAFKNEAVIFVEVVYDYRPLIGNVIPTPEVLTSIASFPVRDERDLTQIYQRDASNPDPAALCTTYDHY